jgi:hypothetical protein
MTARGLVWRKLKLLPFWQSILGPEIFVPNRVQTAMDTILSPEDDVRHP